MVKRSKNDQISLKIARKTPILH